MGKYSLGDVFIDVSDNINKKDFYLNKMLEDYHNDVEQYPIYLLDLRIAMLEKKINDMSKKGEVD